MLAFLPLLLALSSLATTAVIPSSSIPPIRDSPVPQSTWESADSPRVSAQSANQNAEPANVVKGTPYYFPEMMPDQDEIADRLNALHEAGSPSKQISKNEGETSMHQDQAHDLPQQSIGTPDATTIDTSRARMLLLPDSESSAELAESLERSYSDRTRLDRTRQGIQNGPFVGQALRIDWVITEAPIIITTPPIIPSMVFLFFIAAVLCIATVVRGVRRRH